MQTAQDNPLGRRAPFLIPALLVGLALPTFLAIVRVAGLSIPTQFVETDYLMGLCWALLLGLSILIWPVPACDRVPLLILWAARTLVTLGFMLTYEWYYGPLDAMYYFGASLQEENGYPDPGWGRGTSNMYHFAWLHTSVLGYSYHAMKVTFSMVGFLGVYLIYRGCVRVLGREDRRLLFLLGLYPSILFWSSILGKDPVQLLGIGLYAYGVLSWRATDRARYAIPIALGIAVATYMRLWYAVIMVVPLLIFIILGVRSVASKVVFLAAAGGAMAWAVSLFVARFQLNALEDLYRQAQEMALGWDNVAAESGQILFPDLTSLITFAPIGAFTALFRPVPGEIMNPFGLLAGVENAFLLTLVVLAFVRAGAGHLREPLVRWALLLVGIWAVLHGFVSYYNLGAAVRFRTPILPILLCLLLYLSRRSGDRSLVQQASP